VAAAKPRQRRPPPPAEEAAPAEATEAEAEATEAEAAATEAEAEATEAEATEAEAAPTEAPAEEAAPAAFDRTKTLIMDIDGGRLQDPEGVYNPYVPGNRRDQGFHQVCLEPLFILNYQTGAFEPWLGESFVSNETLDEWTLTLREGVTWQDGTPFTADDVVFTIQTLIDNAPELSDSQQQCNSGSRAWKRSMT
jgi:ABC-type transport system substrate-binding protein